MGDVDGGGGCGVGRWDGWTWDGGTWELYVLSPQFFCECNTAQKTEIYLKGEKFLPKVAVRSK